MRHKSSELFAAFKSAGKARVVACCLIFVGCAVLFSHPTKALAQGKSTETAAGSLANAAASKSRFFLENQFLQLSDEQREAKAKVTNIDRIVERAAKLRENIENYSFEGKEYKANIDSFKQSFDTFVSSFRDTSKELISDRETFVKDMINKFRILDRSFRDDRLAKLEREFNLFGGRRVRGPSAPLSQDAALISNYYDSVRQELFTGDRTGADRIMRLIRGPLYRGISGKGDVPKSGLIEEVNDVEAGLSTLTADAIEESFRRRKDGLLRGVKAFELLVQGERSRRRDALDQIEVSLEKVNTQLINVETVTLKSQTEVDESLIIAVYMMIVAILFMFLALHIFADKTAERIIEKRALVELVGISFLLITIIILGTGGKIDQSALAALLGTIAGYVFGRGTGAAPSPPNTPATTEQLKPPA